MVEKVKNWFGGFEESVRRLDVKNANLFRKRLRVFLCIYIPCVIVLTGICVSQIVDGSVKTNASVYDTPYSGERGGEKDEKSRDKGEGWFSLLFNATQSNSIYKEAIGKDIDEPYDIFEDVFGSSVDEVVEVGGYDDLGEGLNYIVDGIINFVWSGMLTDENVFDKNDPDEFIQYYLFDKIGRFIVRAILYALRILTIIPFFLIEFILGLAGGTFHPGSVLNLLLGRVGSGGTLDINLYGFELVKNNPYGIIGTVVYGVISSIATIGIALKFISALAKTAWGGSGESRTALKDVIGENIRSVVLITVIPYLVYIVMFLRDIILYEIANIILNIANMQVTESGPGFTQTVDTSLILIMSRKTVGMGAGKFANPFLYRAISFNDGSIVDSLMYCGSVVLLLAFMFMYISLALDTTLTFALAPVSIISGKDSITEWIRHMVANILTPIVDLVVLAVPILVGVVIQMGQNSGTYGLVVGGNLIALVLCFSYFPLRKSIQSKLRVQNGGAEAMGSGALFGLMGAARMLMNGVSAISGKVSEGASAMAENAENAENARGVAAEQLSDASETANQLEDIEKAMDGVDGAEKSSGDSWDASDSDNLDDTLTDEDSIDDTDSEIDTLEENEGDIDDEGIDEAENNSSEGYLEDTDAEDTGVEDTDAGNTFVESGDSSSEQKGAVSADSTNDKDGSDSVDGGVQRAAKNDSNRRDSKESVKGSANASSDETGGKEREKSLVERNVEQAVKSSKVAASCGQKAMDERAKAERYGALASRQQVLIDKDRAGLLTPVEKMKAGYTDEKRARALVSEYKYKQGIAASKARKYNDLKRQAESTCNRVRQRMGIGGSGAFTNSELNDYVRIQQNANSRNFTSSLMQKTLSPELQAKFYEERREKAGMGIAAGIVTTTALAPIVGGGTFFLPTAAKAGALGVAAGIGSSVTNAVMNGSGRASVSVTGGDIDYGIGGVPNVNGVMGTGLFVPSQNDVEVTVDTAGVSPVLGSNTMDGVVASYISDLETYYNNMGGGSVQMAFTEPLDINRALRRAIMPMREKVVDRVSMSIGDRNIIVPKYEITDREGMPVDLSMSESHITEQEIRSIIDNTYGASTLGLYGDFRRGLGAEISATPQGQLAIRNSPKMRLHIQYMLCEELGQAVTDETLANITDAQIEAKLDEIATIYDKLGILSREEIFADIRKSFRPVFNSLYGKRTR